MSRERPEADDCECVVGGAGAVFGGEREQPEPCYGGDECEHVWWATQRPNKTDTADPEYEHSDGGVWLGFEDGGHLDAWPGGGLQDVHGDGVECRYEQKRNAPRVLCVVCCHDVDMLRS